MRSFLPLTVLLLCGSCVAPTVDRVDTALKDRIDQIDVATEKKIELAGKVSEEKIKRLEEVIEKNAARVEALSNDWMKQSDAWRDSVDKIAASSEKESALWRDAFERQGELFRKSFESESEKTRVFIREMITEAIPKATGKSIGEAAASAGLPTKQDDLGRTVIDWIAIISLLANGVNIYRNIKNNKTGAKRWSAADIKKMAKEAAKES